LLFFLDDNDGKYFYKMPGFPEQHGVLSHDLYNTEDQSSYTVGLNLTEVRGRFRPFTWVKFKGAVPLS